MPRGPLKRDHRDRLIEATYYATCENIPIRMLDIERVFAEGRKALDEGRPLGEALRAFVETIRTDRGERR